MSKKNLVDVKMDRSGMLANDYVDICEEIKSLGEKKESTAEALCSALAAQGRTSISCNGYTLEVNHREAKVVISLKSPKKKKG